MLIQYLDEAREGGLADPTIADLSLPELQVCAIALSNVEADISTNTTIMLRGTQKGALLHFGPCWIQLDLILYSIV